MEIKRIAILTLGVGPGRLRASQAVHQALHDGVDDVDARTIDVLDLAKPWFYQLYVRRTRCWASRWWRWPLHLRQAKRGRSAAFNWVYRRGCGEVLDQLRAFRPHLVIATEVGAAELSALGKREGLFSATLMAAQTDFHTDAPWVKPEIDVYCVANDAAKYQLLNRGVSANRIVTCGIPVDPAFALSFDRAELRRALGLDLKRPAVLVMGSGMDPALFEGITQNLELCRQPVQVIAAAGRNQALRMRLEALRGQLALDLRVFGWTDTIPELMGAANLLIAKPGSVTTSEALAAGLPMILTDPAAGAEVNHLKFLVDQGLAVSAEGFREIPHQVSRLLGNSEQLDAWSRRAREAARPDAAYSIAQVARALLEKASFIDLLAAPLTGAGESAYVM